MLDWKRISVCLVGSLALSGAQDPTSAPTPTGWGGCVDLSKPEGTLVTIGETTPICLVVADGADWSTARTYMRLNFLPQADTYSRFHVPDSFQNLVVDDNTRVSQIYAGKNITVHVASQTALSFQRRYYDSFDKIYPHLTAIVNVDQGVVTGITWDDACVFCSKGECEPNTFDFSGFAGNQEEFQQPVDGCFIAQEACQVALNEQRTECDLLLYVVWTGTDSKGDPFLPSANRFSAFPAQELSDRFSQNLPDFPTLTNNGRA